MNIFTRRIRKPTLLLWLWVPIQGCAILITITYLLFLIGNRKVLMSNGVEVLVSAGLGGLAATGLTSLELTAKEEINDEE